MMKYYTVAAFSLFGLSSADAQLVHILNDDGELVNETTITVVGDAAASVIDQDLPVVLQGADAREVDMVRYEESDCTGTQNYFCWGECWLPVAAGERPSWNAIEPVTLSPNEEFIGFHAYWKPMGMEMTCCFLFTWHATDDYNDSTWVRICFESQIVGISETAANAFSFDVSPNPTSAGAVNVEFSEVVTGGQAELVWHSAAGSRVVSTPITQGAQRTVVSAADLTPGVWFAQLRVNGEALATRKVIIE